MNERIQEALSAIDDEISEKTFEKNYYKWLDERLEDKGVIRTHGKQFYLFDQASQAFIFLGEFLDYWGRYHCAYLHIAYQVFGI